MALGALASVIAIDRAIPITHCGPGCATKQFHALSGISGYQGGEFHVPSTNIGNKEVIFGGADRLDELYRLDPQGDGGRPLCCPERLRAELSVTTSANRGTRLPAARAYQSYSPDARLSRQRTSPATKRWSARSSTKMSQSSRVRNRDPQAPRQRLVAAALPEPVLARRPGRDPPHPRRHWPDRQHPVRPSVRGLERVAGDSVGRAEHRALALARVFDRTQPRGRYGQRVLHEPAIPIGARATGAFLRRVGDAVGVDPDRVENFIRQEERTYYHYLRDFAQFYAGCTSQYRLPSEVNIVGESAYALAIAKFLVGDLGLNPGVFVLTENPPDNERAAIVEAFRDLAPGIDGEPLFEPEAIKRPQIHRRPSTRRRISDRVRIDLGRGGRRRDRRAAGRDQLSGDRRSGAGPHLRRLSWRAAAP